MEARRLVRTDSPGRPPQLSHSSWTMHYNHNPNLTFQYPSSKLCLTWLCHWRDTPYRHTSVHQCCQGLIKGLAVNKNVETTQRWCTLDICKAHPSQVKKNQSHLYSNNFGFICAGVSNGGIYRRNAWYKWSCLLRIYCHLSTSEKLSWQFSEMYGITSYGNGGRNVVNQCLGLSYNTRFYCNTKLLFSDGLGQK